MTSTFMGKKSKFKDFWISLCSTGYQHELKIFIKQSRLLRTLKKKAFENVGKEENAGNQLFLLFPQCFLPYLREIIIPATFILSSTNAFNLYQSKFFLFGKDLRIYFERLSRCYLTLDHTFRTFNDLRKKPFENIEGEEENAGSLAFSPFPAMLSSLPYTNFNF